MKGFRWRLTVGGHLRGEDLDGGQGIAYLGGGKSKIATKGNFLTLFHWAIRSTSKKKKVGGESGKSTKDEAFCHRWFG